MGLKKVGDVDARGAWAPDEPLLAIYGSNAKLNKAASDKYYDGEEYAEVYVDVVNNLLGFSFNDGGGGSTVVDLNSPQFAVGKGLNKFGIVCSEIEETHKFEIINGDYDMPVVEIDELVEEYGEAQ